MFREVRSGNAGFRHALSLQESCKRNPGESCYLPVDKKQKLAFNVSLLRKENDRYPGMVYNVLNWKEAEAADLDFGGQE